MRIRVIALAIGFLINVLGNSLTIASSMGAEPWAAAAQNLSETIGYSVGVFLFIFGVGNAVLNQCLIKTTDMARFIGEVLYIGVFSYAVDLCLSVLYETGIKDLSTLTRGFLSCLGVALFCLGISLYQRANILMHPNDDTSNLIRFRVLDGSAVLSQLVDIIPAFVIIGVCWAISGNIYSINIGTVFSLVCNGILIKYSDRWLWPQLKHNHHKHVSVKRLTKKVL